ncbi:neurotrypsin-like isoform X2 [Apostichopus japonicus]|uniref:neurotrypsin-like isoform X2 n=1 Tax=Stichopus japonicus TaxID=307972 RepID=UPI003AB45306
MLAMFSIDHLHLFVFLCAVCQAEIQDGDIRIMSDNPREGHVEVFLEDEWGTISTIEFDDATTTVVCRQLGFHGPAESIKSTEHLGLLSSPEWNIKCPEGAESILDCDRSKREGITDDVSYASKDYIYWDHEHDLGVSCVGFYEPSVVFLGLLGGLSLLLFVFIVCLVYLACHKTTAQPGATVNPEHSANSNDHNPMPQPSIPTGWS